MTFLKFIFLVALAILNLFMIDEIIQKKNIYDIAEYTFYLIIIDLLFIVSANFFLIIIGAQ